MTSKTMNDIDSVLAAQSPIGSDLLLDGMETRVWQRIEARIERARTVRMQGAALAVALVVGIVNGGIAVRHFQPAPDEMQAFSLSSGLIPFSQTELG
ncbi:hypothetical protein [Brevundimonas sp.]|uniref:hypothetical protein n=1 Tax=Brevundimonas sp. TaxID=1871086 RepID=UPI002FC9C8D5